MPRRKIARTKTAWWLDATLVITVRELAQSEGIKANRVVAEALELGLSARREQRRAEREPTTAELEQRLKLPPAWDL